MFSVDKSAKNINNFQLKKKSAYLELWLILYRYMYYRFDIFLFILFVLLNLSVFANQLVNLNK